MVDPTTSPGFNPATSMSRPVAYGEAEVAIDGPHGSGQAAEHQAQRAVALAAILDGVLQVAIEVRVVDRQRDHARERLGRHQIGRPVVAGRRPRRQREDADDPIAGHQRDEHRRLERERVNGHAIALADFAGTERLVADVSDQQGVA
jgi:hypothetical protein